MLGDIDIFPLVAKDYVRNRQTNEVELVETVLGYVLSRDGQYCGLHLSWSPSLVRMIPFPCHASAVAALPILREIDEQRAREAEAAKRGATIQHVSIRVPVDITFPPMGKAARVTAELEEREVATLGAIAAALGVKPQAAIGALLRLVPRPHGAPPLKAISQRSD